MILVYVLLLLLLVVARFFVARRAAALERKYMRIARATDELCKAQTQRPGNNKPDPYAAARAAYLLGQAVERRERLEARYCAWQKTAERLNSLIAAVRNWRGRRLLYVVGALDVLFVLGALDYLGYGQQISARTVVQFVRSFVA
jgi:hypothetical protein